MTADLEPDQDWAVEVNEERPHLGAVAAAGADHVDDTVLRAPRLR